MLPFASTFQIDARADDEWIADLPVVVRQRLEVKSQWLGVRGGALPLM